MGDLVLEKNLKKGSKGKQVKIVQEWLCLHDFNIAIDGDFGPASEHAVKEFQKKAGLLSDGIVGQQTFSVLIKPMTDAVEIIPANGKSLSQMVVAYSKKHLKEHPREIGGQNCGPWVRLYMNGNEGNSWPWCAGFASFILKQACESLNVPLPITTSFSCDTLAANAREKEIFLSENQAADRKQIKPGALFLNRRTSTDWVHTGIVIKAEDEIFHTIEGNTNDEGSREGYEVCQRIRGYKQKDFILI